MDNELILDEKKEYNHKESKNLLEQVRNFFQKSLKVIVSEWIPEQKNEAKEDSSDDYINLFAIEKINQPIYAECNGYDDVERILDLFDSRLNTLIDNFDNLLNNNKDLDDESKSSLESYANAIDKCITVYENQRRRRSEKFKKLTTIEELREELQHLFSEIIGKYIIAVLIDALYGRIKNNASIIYSLVLKEINEFFVENGIYTKTIISGEFINPEFVEPSLDSANNMTDDFQKFDTIDEIHRYPYLFTDDTKILDGSAKIWRRKN